MLGSPSLGDAVPPAPRPMTAELVVAAAVDDVGPGEVADRALNTCTSRVNGHNANNPKATSACSWNPIGASAIREASG